MTTKTPDEISQHLAAPFDPRDVKLKPKIVKGNRCLALSYIDARLVQDRLDSALGVANWQDEYQILPDGSVQCQLRLKIGDEWVTKSDVGSQSEQDDAGDRLKAAFSDALKRAAVKFGIGRYLYAMKGEWMEYDPVTKRIIPPGKTGSDRVPPPSQPIANGQPKALPAASSNGNGHTNGSTLPRTGKELYRRLAALDEQLTLDGKCQRRELINFVRDEGAKNGYTALITEWTGPGIALAADIVRAFMRERQLEAA